LIVGLIIPFTGYRGIYMVMALFAAICLLFYYLLHGKKAISDKDEARLKSTQQTIKI
jgi:hypothetical protein